MESLIQEFVWQRREISRMRKSTIQTGGAAAAYVPVDADFQWKNQSDELELDNNFAAQSFWKDVLLR